QKLFEFSAPTGLPDVRYAWWNTNQVFGRWTLANALISRYFGEQTELNRAPANVALDLFIAAPSTSEAVVDQLVKAFIGRAIDNTDRSALIAYLSNGDLQIQITSASPRLRTVIGAVAASPYAQWR
ncbi:MAG: DUF1800 family protein, partial [Caldilinea sp.]